MPAKKKRCTCDDGYTLPPLDVRWHEVPTSHDKARPDQHGQGRMFKENVLGLSEAAAEKRDSLPARVAKLREIMAESPDDHFLIWHDLEAERHAIEEAFPDVTTVCGTDDTQKREDAIVGFGNGTIKNLATKPSMYGAGVNLQRHCHRAVFLGIGFKFADLIQAIHRILRYLQPHKVRIDLIFTEAEHGVRKALETKWEAYKTQSAKMSSIIREHGLATISTADTLRRTIGCERKEYRGEQYLVVQNDTVLETGEMDDRSIGLIVTSIPFAFQYEYTPSYNDFGHTESNAHFWAQMDFLSPNLFRVLSPGRVMAIHVKDRITPGGLTGLGFQTLHPFHAEAIFHYQRHGFAFLGMKTVVTDVVRENNQTYRLGWTEQCKDGSRMGCGVPEYVLLFRKPQTDRTAGYADVPVVKQKPLCDDNGAPATFDKKDNWRQPIPGTGYSRSKWQLDAHGFTRSGGNRLLTPEELQNAPHEKLYKLWRDRSTHQVYDYAGHVAIAEELDRMQRLPATFMLFPPHSWHPDVWTDVARMRTLNMEQERRGQEQHLCLAAGSLVLTRDGYLPIQDVAVGDYVLTHNGRWRRVLAVQNTGVRPVVTVKAQGVPGLTLTPDHKLWTRSVGTNAEAVAHSRRHAKGATPDWAEAQHVVGSYINLKLPPIAEPPSVDNERHWWTVGRWLADGHIDSHGGAHISCGPHKLDALTSAIGDYGGNPAHGIGSSLQVLLRDPGYELRATLKECGTGASGKHLPPEAYTLPGPLAKALLDGYLSGDGHFLKSRCRWMATSVSKTLLLGMAMLAQRVHGSIASVYAGRPAGTYVIQGRTVNTKQEWILSFDIPNANRKNRLPFIEDDGAWKKVRSVEPAGEVETWNLRVDEDESYTAEGCIVKNCPLQFDIVDRLIIQLSMEGETVLDPFAGIGTVPYCAVKLKRRGIGIELNANYARDGARYCRMAEERQLVPTLFDMLAAEASAEPEPAAIME